MKRFLKSGLSLVLALTIILGSAYVGLGEIDFGGLFTVKAEAASESDLTFGRNSGGNSYSVTDCNTSASGELVIPSTYKGLPVTSIGCEAFAVCRSLTSITIPNSVTSIGSHAFYECTSLTSITIPDGVTSIGDDAFYYCTSLTSITIPDSVTSIGYSAFDSCTSLTSITIPDSVTSIGNWAFEDCTNLASITIPAGVTSIGNRAFYKTAYYDDSSNWENDVLYICNHLIEAKTSISGDYIIKDGTKTIANYAFYECASLTSITIPDSVTSIGDYAFLCCTNLTSITIPDSVTSIGERAFKDCTSLESITIPDSVTSIGDYAFKDCTSLTSVTIPDSVTSIGNYAFYYCTNLTDVYYSGTEADWRNIMIGSDNSNLTNATIHYHEHSYSSDWIVDSEPTCTEAGSKHNTCSACGDVVTEAIKTTGHNYSDWIVDSEPTCAEAGSKHKTCSVCGKVVTEVIEATGIHDLSDWIIDYNSNCLYPGLRHKACSTCDYVEEETIDVVNHSEGYDVVIVDDCLYTGEEVEPFVGVSYKGKILEYGTDYELFFENNTACGNSAKVTVTGIGDYADLNVTKTFNIFKRDISEAEVYVEDCVYDRFQQKPEVTVTVDGIELTADEDYILDYINNSSLGTATVKVIGINNFYGSVEENFEITYDNRTITLEGGLGTTQPNPTFTSIVMGPGKIRFKIPCSTKRIYSYKITDVDTGATVYSYETGNVWGYYDYFEYDFRPLASSTETKGYSMRFQWMDYSANSYTGFITIMISPSSPNSAKDFSLSVPESSSLKNDYVLINTEYESYDIKTPVWTSSNNNIATVENGTVTWLAPGTVTITAKTCGISRSVELTKECCDLAAYGEIVTAEYFYGEPAIGVTYNGELLEEGVDYSLNVTDYGEYSIAEVTGKNLFKGTIFKKFYNDCGSPYICKHNFSDWAKTLDGGCTKTTINTRYCTECGFIEREYISPVGHNYSDWVVTSEPTCEVNGSKCKTCSNCGDVVTEAIDAIGHDYSTEWTIDENATCTLSGSKSHHCTRCDAKTDVTNIVAKGHNYGEWVITAEPTCTEYGVAENVCSICDYKVDSFEYNEKLIDSSLYPESDHYYGNNTSKTYEFSYPGAQSLTLTFSSSTYTETNYDFIYIYDANGSLYGKYSGSSLAGATITLQGSSFSIQLTSDSSNTFYGFSFNSIVANMNSIDAIKPLGHDYSTEWTIDKEATCTESGRKYHSCSRCDAKSDTTVIEATGHSYSDWVTLLASTCVEAGVECKTCSGCNEKIYQEVPISDSHISSDWITDKKATCTEDGSKHKECTVCGIALEEATIPQLTCAAPKLTKVESTSSGVKVTWGKTSGADSYNIYRKTYSNGKWSGWSAIKSDVSGSATSYTDTTAKSGVYYIYTVRGVNEAGKGSYNSTGLKTKFLATPKLSSVSNGSGKVTVKWSKVTGASSYTVYRKTYSNGKWSGWSKVGTTKNNYFNDTKVSSGKNYKYTVRATSGDYSSYFNTSGLKIKYLAVVSLKSATSQKAGVKVTWGKVTGAKGYEVYRRTYSKGKWSGWTKIKTVSSGSTVSYTDKTAKKGVTYKYTVRAISDSNKGSYNTSGLQVKDKY